MSRLKLRDHEQAEGFEDAAGQAGSGAEQPDAVLEQGLEAGGFRDSDPVTGRRQYLPDLQGGLVRLGLLNFIQSI